MAAIMKHAPASGARSNMPLLAMSEVWKPEPESTDKTVAWLASACWSAGINLGTDPATAKSSNNRSIKPTAPRQPWNTRARANAEFFWFDRR